MKALRLFIWEGNGISDAYHDDGTLVVLAHDAAEARAVMRKTVSDLKDARARWEQERNDLAKRLGYLMDNGTIKQGFWRDPEAYGLWERATPHESGIFDGKDEALDREPDRVVEIDGPKWIAFNGGGYD